MKNANFKILELDKWEQSMVIDWGDDCVYKHTIPDEMIYNDLPLESIVFIIEDLRPVAPEIKSLGSLESLMSSTLDASRDDEFQSLLDDMN